MIYAGIGKTYECALGDQFHLASSVLSFSRDGSEETRTVTFCWSSINEAENQVYDYTVQTRDFNWNCGAAFFATSFGEQKLQYIHDSV